MLHTISPFNTKDINPLQEQIMRVIDSWVRTQKTPVPQKEIIARLGKQGEKSFTVVWGINSLLRKGYIRRAISVATNKTSYVQLRGI